MDRLLERVRAIPLAEDFLRNIKYPRRSQDLFDDLADTEQDADVAHALRARSKPASYRSPPILYRPADLADYVAAIQYPFRHIFASRYSDGSYGVWYGAGTLETTIHETAFHWRRYIDGLELKPEFATGRPVISERRVYRVLLRGLMTDLRPHLGDCPQIMAPDTADYGWTQRLGRELRSLAAAGLVSHSVRDPQRGTVAAVFDERILSNPRQHCNLRYVYHRGGTMGIERGSRRLFDIG